jgi:hypothetical protein
MKTENRNFIDNLTSTYNADKAKVKKEEVAQYSLFENIFDIASKYKKKLFTSDKEKLTQINQLCRNAIKNNEDKIKNLALNAQISINISLPKDGNFNTTFLTLHIKNTGPDKFNVYRENKVIMENVSQKSIYDSISISGNDSKKLTAQVKLFKFHDIKEKLSLFNIIAMHFKSLSNKIKYHIASYAKYKSTNIANQKNIVTTLGYFADLGYKFHNQHPIATKFGMKEPGKIKFSKENIIYSEDKIELTNREQLFDVCLKIVSSKELLSNFTTVSVNIKNKEEVVELVANLLRCYKSFNKKPIANLSKHELSTLVSKLSSTKNLNVTMIEDNLKLLGTLKGLGYPIDDVAISPEGKITFTSPKSWEKVLDIVSNKNNSNKQEFLSILEKNNSCLFIQQAPKSQKFNYHTHLTEQNIEQIFLDFERPGSLFTIDKVQFTETIFKTRFEKLRKENHGTKLAVKLFKEIAADESLDVATRELFKKMTDEDEKFTPYGEKILKLLILSTQTYNPEILGAMAISAEIARSGNNLLYMAVGKTLTNINNLLSRQNDKTGVPRYQETSNISFNTATDEVSITSPLDVPVSVKGKLEDGILTVTESAVSPFASIILNEKYRGLLQHSDPSTYSGVYEAALLNIDKAIVISDTCKTIEQKILTNNSGASAFDLASIILFNAISEKNTEYKNHLEKSFAVIIDQQIANRLNTYESDRISAFWNEKIDQELTREEIFKSITDPQSLWLEKNTGGEAPQVYIIKQAHEPRIIKLGLSGRDGNNGELRGHQLIEAFKDYQKEHPGASLYELVNSSPKTLSKKDILEDQGISKCAGYLSTDINVQKVIKDFLYESINNGTLCIPYLEYPFNILNNLERINIYTKLATARLSISQIKNVMETISKLKTYGYDISKISIFEDGTLILTDIDNWNKIMSKIALEVNLSPDSSRFMQLLVDTQDLILIKRPCEIEVDINDNCYEEKMLTDIWKDVERCSKEDTITIGTGTSIRINILQEFWKNLENKKNMSPLEITVAVIAQMQTDSKIPESVRAIFATMLTQDINDLTDQGKDFMVKLNMTIQSQVPLAMGVAVAASSKKSGYINSAVTFNVGAITFSTVTVLDTTKNLKKEHKIIKLTYLDSGEFCLDISKYQSVQISGKVISEIPDQKKLQVSEVKTPLFWDLSVSAPQQIQSFLATNYNVASVIWQTNQSMLAELTN